MLTTQGRIHFVDDSLINMPPDHERTRHKRRTVVVVSGEQRNQSDVVIVCPISSKTSGGDGDIRVYAAMGGLKKKGWILTTLVQPVERAKLEDSSGCLPAAVIGDVLSTIARHLDLVSAP